MSDCTDVAIVGGGLAGQCLARQLRQNLPDLDVTVIDRMLRPLPEAAFKVGEATVEMGAHYLSQRLHLAPYLRDRHLLKMGLRYFHAQENGFFGDRPELGLSEPPWFETYLLDRGRLENDLRSMNEASEVHLIEGVTVDDIELSNDGGQHSIHYTSIDGDERGLTARWLVDATGRRRMLQRKLGLGFQQPTDCSAAWFRVAGRVEIGDLVSADDSEWHERVPPEVRHRAVIHLLGRGYWVWIIALASEATSIGIVTDEQIHPLRDYSRLDRAMAWLTENEPDLAEHLRAFPVLDFRVMKSYSYSAKQVFSEQRWSCVGEAGVFADPFYSPGIDMIGVGNTITVEMIRRDLEGRLSPRDVDLWNKWFIATNRALADNIQVGYKSFGHPMAATAKLLWDFASAWGYEAPQILNRTYLDREGTAPMRGASGGFVFLQTRMQRLFADWANGRKGSGTYRFLDYLTLPFLIELRDRNLFADKSLEELTSDARRNMAAFEELAQVLFLAAVADQLPDHYDRFASDVWLNAYAVGLDPSKWETDGLFQPKSKPRDIAGLRRDVFEAMGLRRRVTQGL